MIEKKTVVVVEDVKNTREGIVSGLNQYGFDCRGEDLISQTIDLLNDQGGNISVVILDMDLTDFPDYSRFAKKIRGEYSGAKLIKEFFKNRPDRRPEVVILSGWAARVSYYKQAIEVEASAYLNKTDTELLIPMVQVLSLKHAFQPSVGNNQELSRFVVKHTSKEDLLRAFCVDILAAELNRCFTSGTYVLLYRVKSSDQSEAARKTSLFTEISGLPQRAEFDYDDLHRRIIDNENSELELDSAALDEKFAKLGEFTFIKLADTSEVEISIGFLNPFPLKDEDWYPFTTKAVVRVLADYAAPALERHIGKMMYYWREKLEVKLERVQNSARLSDAIYNNFNGIIPGKQPTSVEETSNFIERLKQFSESLSNYSDSLLSILKSNQTSRQPDAEKRLSEIVRELEGFAQSKRIYLDLKNDCRIPVDAFNFALALNELIKWTVSRDAEPPVSENLSIELDWTVEGDWLEIFFRENGARLSPTVRASETEEPFSSLHVAKLIVEVACRGMFVDDSDALPGERGHLFKIRLPND